jgi:PAS domain S-box-containing protein
MNTEPAPQAADRPGARHRAAGSALLFLAACTGAARLAGAPELVQFDAARPPAGWGAIALALWGAAHLFGARALCAAAALAALATVPLGTPVGFVLAVCAGAWSTGGPRWTGPSAVLATVLSLVALWGRDDWPLLDAVAVAIGCAPRMLAAARIRERMLAHRYALPLAVAGVGFALTADIAHTLDAEQTERIQRLVQFEADHVQRLVRAKVPDELRALAQAAKDWAEEPDPAARRRAVATFLGQRPGAIGVAKVDANGTVRWDLTTLNPRFPVEVSQLCSDATLSEAVEAGREVLAVAPRSAFGGQRILLLFAPTATGHANGGTLFATRAQDFFAALVRDSVAPGCAVEIRDRGDTLFDRHQYEMLFDRHQYEIRHRAERRNGLALELPGLQARLELWPTDDVLTRENLSHPLSALLIGLFGTGLFALAVHLAQTARRRTHELETEVRERRAAEGALQRSEQLYRGLIENLGQAVFLQNADQRYVAANPQFCREVGRTEAEVFGATDADLCDPIEAVRLSADVRAVLATGDRRETEREVTTGGQRRTVRRVLTPVRDAAGRITGVLGIGWDVTEQRKLEAHLNQSSKMDAIGQLAGGIAHDFNNLLTAVIGNLDVLRDGLPEGAPDLPLVDSAQRAAERAAALTQRLLGFARRHQLDWRPVQVNALASEVVELLRRTIDPLIEIEARPAADVWPVRADPDQLNQVLMNLCLNARDAISGRGRVTVETACVTAAEVAALGTLGAGPGDFVRLSVTDTGSGMTPEVRAKIFEPFFTTKEVGKGTGLGLAMAFAIVRQHKGWIDCRSEPGVGSRFDVYLPRAEPAHVSARPPRVPPSRAHGHGTVLVVDDEPLVRDLARAALASGGYTVLTATNGREAVELYAARGDEIALVVLDLTMPVLSGHEAFRQLLALSPRVRVLFVSGYSPDQLTDLERERMAGFLKKPYRPHELLAAVEGALRAQPRSVADLSLSYTVTS